MEEHDSFWLRSAPLFLFLPAVPPLWLLAALLSRVLWGLTLSFFQQIYLLAGSPSFKIAYSIGPFGFYFFKNFDSFVPVCYALSLCSIDYYSGQSFLLFATLSASVTRDYLSEGCSTLMLLLSSLFLHLFWLLLAVGYVSCMRYFFWLSPSRPFLSTVLMYQ